ncbi:MAG: hypothetical protein ACLQGP_28405 [Isosphaeraceae bacterium]
MPDHLLPIHGCENQSRAGDVVFVHGLNGNARDYWCHEGKPENYWPTWLGEALPNIGVWSLGYENAAFRSRRLSFLNWSGYRGFAMPLWDRAKSVLLQLEVSGFGKRPLVFVTHSMGGLLVKQILRIAYESPDQGVKALLENTRGVCFIATPHIGSDLAKWASYFQTLLGINVSIDELKPHGSLLRELNELYRNLVTRKDVNIKTLSFYETKPLFGGTLVVAEGDADPGVPQAGLYALGADHISICKPRSTSDPLNIKIINFIRSDCFQLAASPPSHPEPTPGPSPPPFRKDQEPRLMTRQDVDTTELIPGPASIAARSSAEKNEVRVSGERLGVPTRLAFVRDLSGLAPADWATLVAAIEGAGAHVSRLGTVAEQVAELVRWAESPIGPGLVTIQEALAKYSPKPAVISQDIPARQITVLMALPRHVDFVGRTDEPESTHDFSQDRDPQGILPTDPGQVATTASPLPSGKIIQVPSFHFGSVVPPDFFIDREEELEEASRLIQAGQGLLLVGSRRAGKTSFITKLIHKMMGTPGNDILATYLNLQQCTKLTIETFLEHTLLNLIGEMARQLFHCKYSDLLRPDPIGGNERLCKDQEFADFVNLFARIKERTHKRHGAMPSPLLASEYIQLSQALLEILQAKHWRCCVIFYDEANRLPHELSVDLVASNQETLNTAGLISVYAASPEMEKSLDDLREVLGHHLPLGPFRSLEHLRALLARYCRTSDNVQTELPAEPSAIELLWKHSHGLPYIIQLLSGLSFRLARDQHCPVVTSRHVEQAHDQLRREKPHLF